MRYFCLSFWSANVKKDKKPHGFLHSLICSTLSQIVHPLLETFWAWIQLMTQLKIASSLPYFSVKLFILAGRAGGESRTRGESQPSPDISCLYCVCLLNLPGTYFALTLAFLS